MLGTKTNIELGNFTESNEFSKNVKWGPKGPK